MLLRLQPDSNLHGVFCSAELDSIAKTVGKLAADGARILKEQRVALSSPIAQQQIGAAPSLADCVLGLQNLRYMLGKPPHGCS
jgi:Casein Kinase 2 substrate